MKKIFLVTVFCTLISTTVYADNLPGDKDSGESLFNHQCSACHSLDSNRVGPKLGDVYGRKSGTVPDFNYSSAVKSANITWNSETLDKWLSGPQQFIPGQRMNFSISDPQKRADIIAYLKSLGK